MKNTVYKNAAVVTGLSVAERALGFLYRIVLSRLIGAEGLGLYQVALSIFSLFMTFGTGGIPITLSRTVAKHKAEGSPDGEAASVGAGLVLCLCFSLPVCLLCWALGDTLSFLFSDERSLPVFRILLIGLCFGCVYAVVRGYFWGNKRFLAASLLEMTEEIVMVIGGVLLLQGATSPTLGAEKAAWAMVLADVISCLIAVAAFVAVGGRISRPKKQLKPLFNATLPITSVRASGSLVNFAVAVLFPAMLMRAGLSQGEALSVFGVVTGMVVPVLFIPSTLIGSLALVLVPELSEDYHKHNAERLRKNIERGLRFSALVACALIPFFYVLGGEVGAFAFSNAAAGEMISKSCFILLPMSLTMISTSMLNSIGFEKQTFLFFFFGAAALMTGIVLLPSVCGAYAYPIGLGASYTVTTICNLVFLRKKCPIFSKRGGQGCVQAVLTAFVCILPLTLLGQLFEAFFARFTGEPLGIICTAGSMAICTALVYALLKILPAQPLFELCRSRKRKKAQKNALSQ